MDKIPASSPAFPYSQRGVASVGIAFLVLFLIAAALATTFSVTGSVVRDASATDQRLQALYLAESGLERAAGLYMNSPGSGNCSTSFLGSGLSSYSTGSTAIGNITIVSATYGNSDGGCTVRVSGAPTNGQVVRTIESNILPTATNSSATTGSTTFTDNISAGINIMVVLVAWTTTYSNTDVTVSYKTPTSGTYILSKACGSCTPATWSASGTQYMSEIFYLLNPPLGSGNGTVALTNSSATAKFSVGVLNFSGVNQTTPFSSHYESGGFLNAFGKTSVPVSSGSVAVDVLARDNGGSLETTGCARSPIWNSGANGNASAGSFCDPGTGVTSVDMTWDLKGGAKKAYAQSVAVLQGDPNNGNGGRIRQGSAVGGIQSWREVFIPPS